MLLGLVLMSALGGRPATARDRPDCATADRRLSRTVDAYSAAEAPDWTALVPEAQRVGRCYEAAGGVPARFASYWTYVLVQARRLEEAEALLRAFVQDPPGDVTPQILVRMHWRHGYTLVRLGQLVPSLEAYMQAGALADRLPADAAAETLLEVGERFRLLPDFPTAERYFAAAEHRLLRLTPAERAATAPILGYAHFLRGALALDMAEQGELAPSVASRRALGHLRTAARLIVPAADPTQRLRRAHALIELARVLREGGDLPAAQAALTEALRLARDLRGTYPTLLSAAESGSGQLLLARGRPGDAQDAFTRARTLCQEAADPLCEMETLLDLGATAEHGGDLATAERFYRAAIGISEGERLDLGAQAWSAAAFVALQKPYRALVRVLLLQGRTREAFRTLDNTRGRYLRDLQALGHRQNTLDPATHARLDSLSEALRGTRRTLADSTLSITRRSALEREALTLQLTIERASGFQVGPPPDLHLPTLQRALANGGQTLLTYFLDGEEAYAFVVRPDTFAVVRLPTTPAAIQSTLSAASSLWGAGADVDIDLGMLHQLYNLVFRPLRTLIAPGSRLVVVPEGSLTRVPFALLVERSHPRFRYADAPYLVRRYTITTELAAALLLHPASARTGGGLFVLGRTRFADQRPLPRVAVEVERIGLALPRARLALDETATEAALERRLDDVRLLHLASHATADPALPLYSAVRLWDDPDAPDDGVLHLHELIGRSLDADLVVLSGCETARGAALVGEGMLGLQHAFRAAGARSALATLWSVDDRATGELMARFYEALRRGLPKDRALQEAQLGYLAAHRGRDASPFFWAGPVLYGDSSPLPYLAALRPTPVGWYALGLALVAVALALPHVQRRRTPAP